MKPDEMLAEEIMALGRMDAPDRNTALRAAAATLSELGSDGLPEMIRKHGRAVTAVVVAGTMMNDPDRHTPRDMRWAYEVARLYGSQVRAAADTRFHPTYLFKFILTAASVE